MISEKMKILASHNSVIRAMFEEGKKLADKYGKENVFDYSIGNPNVQPPDAIRKAAIEILSTENPNFIHGYMNNSGYEDVRDEISNYINKTRGLNLDRDNLVMTCGAAGGLNIILKSIINPGDEVITFAPYFGEYKSYTENFDGKLIVVPTNTETFEPDPDLLRNAITKKTKALIVNTPNNPTGVIYSREAIKKMCDVLREKEKEFNTTIYLISDEPYRDIAYDGIEVPCLFEFYNNTFIGYSYSKSLSLPGERIGYVAINPEMDDIEDIKTSLKIATRILGFVNAPSLFQRVIAKTLGTKVDVSIYQKSRDLLYNHLISLGFTCVKPQGAFYLFPKCPNGDDKKFCLDAKKFNLLLVPGSSFECPGYARIAYCKSYDEIKRSLKAFEKLAALYNLKKN
ncbi:pyridoxal phosphate-dependent aminotransferase [Clostridium sp. BJN0001]|uniref:pyridoxal phosphate-dependent aminotransferase n=1 Tax=Clostridium sp. BJN0001 TaxID=2930219 RepID=UPI001FD1878E|nr:pyridoxal phosphate-dependent aminotransferase [Clostridium sp. BJN0001]